MADEESVICPGPRGQSEAAGIGTQSQLEARPCSARHPALNGSVCAAPLWLGCYPDVPTVKARSLDSSGHVWGDSSHVYTLTL